MTIKEARELVESHKKDDPNYAKAVEICIKDDKVEVKPKVKSSPEKKAK